MLRLTRWLSLVRRRRDPRTGRLLGNLYVLHDTPLTLFEAVQLDPDYFELLCHAPSHASKSVRLIGLHSLQEIETDPTLQRRILPTRLQVLAQRLATLGNSQPQSYPQDINLHDSEEGNSPLLRNHHVLTS